MRWANNSNSLVPIAPKSEIEDLWWFEDLDCLDEIYLNKYEIGKEINKEYIINYFNLMENRFNTDKWEIRWDRPETKWWNAVNGSPYSK